MKTQFTALPTDVTGCHLVGIDLGYSSGKKTCGIAVAGEFSDDCTFGECIDRTRQAIRDASGRPVLLVVEAVLSTRHAQSGNPARRGEFEQGREWYRQPGVCTFASALRFVDQLRPILRGATEVYIAEAFLSNKKSRTRHRDDAARIASEFWRAVPASIESGVEPASPYVAGVPPIRVLL